ncbi:MAG: NAD(P)/FAD-dependent oxidoreductase [Alphaproteobacteria bacterium]|nr:NAD(P)/FAD-dependent oxidoreductase [Alphaproteobacteria bacterium]
MGGTGAEAQARQGRRPRIAILGAGIAGLCMAIGLARAGHRDFILFEKDGDLGGTWRDNVYPGAACDVPSHLYSFSFAPNPDWSHVYASQPEILAYIRAVAGEYRIGPHIRFNTPLVSAVFDEGRSVWVLTEDCGARHEADIFIAGSGQLNAPLIPDLPGLESFRGPAFHSARWDHACDLAGKRVAVIGTGASAVQFVPAIAGTAAQVDVYQRTPPYVIPRKDRPYTRFEKAMFRRLPWLQRLYRDFIYWRLDLNFQAFRAGTRFAEKMRQRALDHLAEQVADPALRAALTPDYPVGCKRVLISDDYYPALQRPDVALLTAPIERITPGGVVTRDGSERPADVIIYGTGFRTLDFLAPVRILGAGGAELHARWRDGAQAYYGMTVAGFPNFFLLYGPNTNLGHNSIIFMIECQCRYVLACLAEMRSKGWARMEVRPEAEAAFNAELQNALAETAWAGDCRSWYKSPSGRIVNNWSGSTADYARQTRTPRFADFNTRPA